MECLPFVKYTKHFLKKLGGISMEPNMYLSDSRYWIPIHPYQASGWCWGSSLLSEDKQLGQWYMWSDFWFSKICFNTFLCLKTRYVQKQGTVMGTVCAPQMQTCFFSMWERKVFHADWAHAQCWRCWQSIVPLQRFETQFIEFMKQLNENRFNIKFTFNYKNQRGWSFWTSESPSTSEKVTSV